MSRQDSTDPSSALPRLLTLASVVVVVAALYLGREVLIPLALAMLLAFMLTPLVMRLERWRVPRVAGVIFVVAVAFGLIGGLGYVMYGQLTDLAESLPHYKENIKDKVRSLHIHDKGSITKAGETIKEALETSQPATQPAGTQPATQPMPVEVHEPERTTVEYFRDAALSLLGPLGTTGIVAIFVIFMLIYREDLRDRLIRLSGEGHSRITTRALDDAAGRISRYLLMQLLVNMTYGVAIGVGLYFIGVPNAILWGLVAAIVRFIPYIGPWIGAAMPVTLAMAVFEGWTRVGITFGLFVVVELTCSNAIEPWLYGSSAGVSSVAILVSALFWTWLWGPVGLFLSTPLTVVLVVAGKYVPQLEFLHIMLAEEPGETARRGRK